MKRAKFVSKQTVYMRNEDARQQIEREKKKKNPSPIRFGIYLKIEYPCSKNAIPPPTFEIRVETFSSFFPPSNGRAQFRTHDYTLSPRHLFFFFYSRKNPSFVFLFPRIKKKRVILKLSERRG